MHLLQQECSYHGEKKGKKAWGEGLQLGGGGGGGGLQLGGGGDFSWGDILLYPSLIKESLQLTNSPAYLNPTMNATTGSEGVLKILVRGGVAANPVKGIPRARPPDVLHLVARGLRDVVCPTVLPPDKQVQNAIEITVAHLVNHRDRVEFWGERTPQLYPFIVETVRPILPRVQYVLCVKNTKNLDPV